MKLYFLHFVIFICISIPLFGFSQEKHTVKYKSFSMYTSLNEEWSETINVVSTFTFNINERGDIVHIKPNGIIETYRKLTRDKTISNYLAAEDESEGYYTRNNPPNVFSIDPVKENIYYETIFVVNESNELFIIHKFNDSSAGIRVIWWDWTNYNIFMFW